MSLAALLQAARDTLRSEISLQPIECDVRPGPQPPPVFGQRYVALYATRWVNLTPTMTAGVDEGYSIAATVTLRTGSIPIDRLGGDLYIRALTGIEALCRQVMVAVHMNYDLMNLANSFLPDASNKLEQPLFWESCDAEPELRDESWVWAKPQDGQAPTTCALTMEVRFGDARRTQSFENMR